MDVLVFELDRERFGVRAVDVIGIVRAAAVRKVPGAPAIVLGALDVRGTLAAVVDLRARFGLPPRAIGVDDHFVVMRTTARTLALVTDRAESLQSIDEASLVAPTAISQQHAAHVAGIVATADGLVIIADVERFLTEGEEASLSLALQSA